MKKKNNLKGLKCLQKKFYSNIELYSITFIQKQYIDQEEYLEIISSFEYNIKEFNLINCSRYPFLYSQNIINNSVINLIEKKQLLKIEDKFYSMPTSRKNFHKSLTLKECKN